MIEDSELLPLGTSPHRHDVLTVRSGEILGSDGARLTFPALVERLSTVDVVFVGESHAHREHQAIEAQLLEALARRQPGRWAVGMEMFPRQKQPWLDRWVAGELDERQFVKEVNWHEAWGFDWRYYRRILVVARDEHLPVLALNEDPALVRRVGREGLQALSPVERAALPAVDLTWSDHRRLFRALLGFHGPLRPEHRANPHTNPHGHSHRSLFENMYQAQVVRDASMAERARAFLDGPGRGRRLLVVTGSGHVLYGLGINGRLAARAPWLRQLTVMCNSMPDDAEPKQGDRVSGGLADFIWGTAAEGKSTRYPSLGLRFTEPTLRVESVSPHGPAAPHVKPGDQLLALDGAPLGDAFDLRWRLQQKDWGDEARLRLRRAGKLLDLKLTFNR